MIAKIILLILLAFLNVSYAANPFIGEEVSTQPQSQPKGNSKSTANELPPLPPPSAMPPLNTEKWSVLGKINDKILVKSEKGDIDFVNDNSVIGDCFVSYPDIECGIPPQELLKRVKTLKSKEEELQKKINEVSKKESELNELQQKISQLSETLLIMNKEKEEKENEVKELKQKVEQLSKELLEVKNDNSEKNKLIVQLKKEKEDKTKELNQKISELSSQEEVKKIESELKKLQVQLQEFKRTIKQKDETIKELSRKIKEKELDDRIYAQKLQKLNYAKAKYKNFTFEINVDEQDYAYAKVNKNNYAEFEKIFGNVYIKKYSTDEHLYYVLYKNLLEINTNNSKYIRK